MAEQEKSKVQADGDEMVKRTEDVLAEMDESLALFRAKMKAKRAESIAEIASIGQLPGVSSGPSIDAAEPTAVEEKLKEDTSAGSRFKMSLYSRVRPKKDQLDGLKTLPDITG